MKHAKLTLSLLQCLLVCLCLLPAAHADGGTAEPMGSGEAMLPLYAQAGSLPLPAEGDQALSAELTLRFEAGAEAAFKLPKNLKVIEAEAFANDRRITSVYIPASVTRIAEGAFSGGRSLTAVYYGGTEAKWTALRIDTGNDPLLDAIVTFPDGSSRVPVSENFFPDPSFRGYVSDNFDSNGDGYLSGAEIQAVKEIRCYRMDISSLKGVEFFTELTYLDCGFNALTELDVRSNTKLQILGIASNYISRIDLSRNPALRVFSSGMEQQESNGWHTYGNPITALDVTHNPALVYLSVAGNRLTSLDVSKNTALQNLGCWQNDIASLNLTNNRELRMLACAHNPLGTLTLTQNTKLEQLHCMNCGLNSLNLSNKTKLVRVRCFDNQLTSLNVSGCTALQTLLCYNNRLTSLNVSGCTALEHLFCQNNALTTLSVSRCPNLQVLNSGYNELTSLNVQSCPALVEINCSANPLAALDVSGCPDLQYLTCWKNDLKTMDLRQNTALKRVNLSANHDLSSVTLRSLQDLEKLWVQNTGLTKLNISKCPLIVQAYRYGDMTDFGREGQQRDSGNWVGYQYGDGLNPGSSSPVDHCQFCVDKGVSITA